MALPRDTSINAGDSWNSCAEVWAENIEHFIDSDVLLCSGPVPAVTAWPYPAAPRSSLRFQPGWPLSRGLLLLLFRIQAL